MLYYAVIYNSLLDAVDEEVSRVADAAYSDAGESLYDQIIITERDTNVLYNMVDGAVTAIVNRCADVCTYAPTSGSSPIMRLAFYLPDFGAVSWSVVEDELSKFIVYSTVAQFLTQRHPASSPEYNERAMAALAKAASLMKIRKAPLEIWK